MPYKNPKDKREWYKKNRARLLEKQARYYKEHIEERKAYARSWYQKRGKMQTKRLRWNLRTKVVEFLGGECVICNETDIRVLEINHLDGIGYKDRQRYGGDHRFYLAILNREKSKESLDIRCANHNILYEYEVGRRWEP